MLSSTAKRVRGLATASLILIALTSSAQQIDSITVAARFANIGKGMPRTVIINECDISDRSTRTICELDSADSFCAKIPLSFPHTFTVCYNKRNFINAFAAPGDSIHMDIDASTVFSASKAASSPIVRKKFDFFCRKICTIAKNFLTLHRN